MVLSRCRQTKAGSFRWLINIEQAVAPDITILVRMDAQNESASDYYLLPIMDISTPRLMLCESNGAHLDTYHFDSLEYFTTLAKRQRARSCVNADDTPKRRRTARRRPDAA